MELFTATGKLKKALEMFDVCNTGDTAHIDTIFKFFATHASTWVQRYSSLLAAEMCTTMKNILLELFLLSVKVS
jgi:hypothetical protein